MPLRIALLVALATTCSVAASRSPDPANGVDGLPNLPLAPVATLKASMPQEYSRHGQSVAFSSSGTLAFVGAHEENVDDVLGAGAVHVYQRTNEGWSEIQRLTAPSPASGDTWFGFSVAISADEQIAVVGAPRANANEPGSAFVFVREGDTWLLLETLNGTSSVEDAFGIDVAVTADGSRIVVGAWEESLGNELLHGAAYVFARNGWHWTQEARLDGVRLSTNAARGRCVAISADGSKAIVGAPYADLAKEFQAGAVHAFTRSGTSWSAQPAVYASDAAASDRFGWDCALSADGSRVLIGAPDYELSPSGGGAAYVYDTATWQESRLVSTVTPPAYSTNSFGMSVALSDDGRVAAIGAPDESLFTGSAYLFENVASSWNLVDTLHGSRDDTVFGTSIAWSDARGGEMLVGSPFAWVGGAIGSAYVFGDEHIFDDGFGD